MLQRIWASARGQKPEGSSFSRFGLLGDPGLFWAALPEAHHRVWVLPEGDQVALAALLGMAWANGLRVCLVADGVSAREQLEQWCPAAASAFRSQLPADSTGEIKAGPDAGTLLAAWRREQVRFAEGLEALCQTRFGALNALEVAITLAEWSRETGPGPFQWRDKTGLALDYAAYQDALHFFRQARHWREGLQLRRLAGAMEIRLEAFQSRNEGEIARAIASRLAELQQLIRDFEQVAHRLHGLLRNRSVVGESRREAFGRLPLQGLDPEARRESGLPDWHAQWKSWETAFLGDRWLQHFHGLQSLSLDGTARELEQLHEQLTLLSLWPAAISAAAGAQSWLDAQDPHLASWLDGGLRILDGHQEQALSAWYLSGWLEQAVGPALWESLYETAERRDLENQLRQRALATALRSGAGQAPLWRTARPEECVQIDGEVLIYWHCQPTVLPEHSLQMLPRVAAPLPPEYLRLVDGLRQESWTTGCLPFAHNDGARLWESGYYRERPPAIRSAQSPV